MGETLHTLAFKNANQTLNNGTSTQTEIWDSLFPLVTFGRDTLVIRKVGSAPLNKFLQNLRNAGIPQTGYVQLKNAILNGLRELVEDIPRHWRLWAACSREFRLFETATWGELSNLIRLLQLDHFDAPGLLAGATKPRVASWSTTPEFYGIDLLRQCVKCFTSDGNSGPSLLANNPTADALSAAALLKNKTVEPTGYMERDSELHTLMQLPGNFNKLTPMEKTDALQKSGGSLHLRNELLENGAKLNILRTVQGSLRSVASGISNYLRFCTVTDSTSPPPSSGTIRKWIATFNPGETFGLYANQVRKASILLGHDDACLTPEIRLIAKGLRNAQGKSFAFPNFIMTSDLMRIILDHGWQGAVGMIAYLPYLFSPRAPSETLQFTMANPNERLPKFSPQGPKALIVPRTYHDATALATKFRFRENVRGGCILIRPCLCTMVSPPNRAFCPVHGFWATNRND